MKAIHEQGSRTIKFTELEDYHKTGITEMDVSLNYLPTDDRLVRGITLDNEVIPGILRAVNGIKSIVLIGRKWWRNGPGYTVRTATILVDGVEIGNLRRVDNLYSDCGAVLDEAGIIRLERNAADHSHFAGRAEHLRDYCERNNITLYAVETEVGKKSDL